MIYNQTVIALNSYTTCMDAFSAIADPTRRVMLDMLVECSCSAGDIVNAFPKISQPAVSKHLRILRDAGLVSVQVHAQQRLYSLEPKALAELDAWIAKYKVFWSDSLNALEQHLDKKREQKRDEREQPKGRSNNRRRLCDSQVRALACTFPRGGMEVNHRSKRAGHVVQ
jgi:DNA-binding transcriptional ArsR family regulator